MDVEYSSECVLLLLLLLLDIGTERRVVVAIITASHLEVYRNRRTIGTNAHDDHSVL